ncbi:MULTISPECIES: hypothetical protein [unclassified Mesorhizobium]|uniref:hypothetical protein n=1 Tax=unclassified Mesorhizobium TaxID=325217 RepID=UPI0010935246|nr:MULTISPECIES: hypothetical protein [unclassified Mesorhizobium]TGS42802.1 hypothetical protein EN825_18835 [Mesorhizobium sp. M8A.F.Ca.ET.182.01.1.1]TGS79804.1 hypothetical protein EN824_16250 [Mesorhizobium sp. M8A.F.Ca.ET.181.01.1.1]
MKRKPLLFFAFPAFVLLILAAERMATILLGTYPASPGMWKVWLTLHPSSGMVWQQVDVYLGGSMALDFALLGAALGICWMASQARRSAAFFLANHGSLILAASMILIGGRSQTASTIAGFTAPSGFQFSLTMDFTWLNCLLAVIGVTACAYCHFAYIRELGMRVEPLRVRLMALQRDF